jgi:phosphomannomutase
LICERIKKDKFDIGIVTDGDADRIAIIDNNGDFLDAQKTFALLLKYLHSVKKLKGKVVRGYSTSDIIKKYCDKYNLQLETVPIGFKHISKIMINENVMIGAEESGGIGIQGHLPERDGVFNGLLYLEMLASTGKTITEMKKELADEFGTYFYNRIDKHTTEDKKVKTLEICKSLRPGDLIGGKKITEIGNLDGFKFNFDNGWIIVRASGTEPLLRFYCETYEKDETLNILNKTISGFNL